MKLFNALTFVILSMTLLLSACQSNESKRIREEARESLPEPPPNVSTTPVSPTAPTPAVNSNVPHYKCPNNCEGGVGAAAGPCPVCGTQLAHNQAYHNQTNATNPPPTVTPPPNVQQQQQPAPAQNAAGVYHYTCSNGCAGGAGSATACASCGATLVHNQAYHNQ